MIPLVDRQELLNAYDEHLRTDAEVAGAATFTRHGPLYLAVYDSGRGFVTYRHLNGADAAEIRRLVAFAREHFGAKPDISRAEWKSRQHDHAPGLHAALVAMGFAPEEPESIMIGEAQVLAVDVPLPADVELRRVNSEADVLAMCRMQDSVFGGASAHEDAPELLKRLERGDGLELWVAEAGGQIVCAGRLDPVAGTPFAGLWGGATLPAWRGRGIYRALTAARARAALALGKTLLHSDSTEYSRPILERSGLAKVSTTTPYMWRR